MSRKLFLVPYFALCVYSCCDKCYCSFSDIRDKDEWWFSAQQKHCLCVEHPILLDKQRFAQGTLLHVTIMLTISGPINYIGEIWVIYIIIFQLKLE